MFCRAAVSFENVSARVRANSEAFTFSGLCSPQHRKPKHKECVGFGVRCWAGGTERTEPTEVTDTGAALSESLWVCRSDVEPDLF